MVAYSAYSKKPEKYGVELLLTRIPYNSIYTPHEGHTEFLLVSDRYGFKIRIECKWQQSNGSVDEKLPYLYLNCIETMPENHIIIVIDGNGWKKGAVEWLKTAVATKKYTTPQNAGKLIQVLNLQEFMTWANNTFR